MSGPAQEDAMNNPTIDAPNDPGRTGPSWLLPAVGGLAALALIIGLVVWIGTRDDELTSTTTTTAAAGTTTTTVAATTTTTIEATTTTTIEATTTAPTTTVAEFSLPSPGDPTWVVSVFHRPDVSDMTMQLVTTEGDVAVYDGESASLRCVAVVGPADAYSGWCGPTGQATRFVADRGLTPLLVEVGAAAGDVGVAEREASWGLPSNGCSEPMTTLLAALDPVAFVVDRVVCVEGEAFVSIASLLFGERRAPDGGGDLLVAGDEGWNGTGGGTSFDCTDPIADGINRCDRFGVEFELFEATLPIPPVSMHATSPEIVGVRDETSTVRGLAGDETDPAAIATLITDEVVDPDDAAEAPPTVRQEPVGDLTLLVIDVPQLDDSILSTSWAIWIDSDGPRPIVRATAWETCARGLAGPDLCV
jgi:hypothetical protein